MSPFLILLVGVLFIVASIIWLRLHPFFALILAAVLVGVLPSNAVVVDPGVSWLQQALGSFESSATGLGLMAGKIGIVIALAAVIGQCLMESGAADRITRTLLKVFGEKRANWALLLSGYCLSIPVFFDTVFFLLIPLARAMFLRTGKNYMSYVMAICAGGVITHGIVPPTPGPLLMAETLGIELGQAILGGFLIGLPVALFGGLVLPKLFVARGVDIPMRDAPGSSTAQLQEIVDRPEKELPGFFVSILPVALPVILITAYSVWNAIDHQGAILEFMGMENAKLYEVCRDTLALLGNKNLAMFLATGLAMWLLARSKGYSLKQLTTAIEPALKEAGVIILITAAGGAFGGMLKGTGIGNTISDMVTDYVDGGEASWGIGILLILIAWGSAAVMKIAQGSGTVAVITAAGIMAGVLAGLAEAEIELPYHKIYIFAAISFGAKVISWMNDSGYWVVCKMSGFTEKETLKTWTMQLAAMGVFGLIEVLILSQIVPLK